MISLKNFTGEFPRTATHLLPENAATNAVDCDFTANTLTGIGDYSLQSVPATDGVRSAFFYSNSDSGNLSVKTFAWSEDVDIVRGPVANDMYDRMYWSDGSKLKVTRNALVNSGDAKPDDANTFFVGVPVPEFAPALGDIHLTYDGSELTDVVAVCETPSGTVLSAESIFNRRSVIQNDASGLSLSFDYAASCKIYNSNVSTLGVTALPPGFTPQGDVSVYFSAPIQIEQIVDFIAQRQNNGATSLTIYNAVGGAFETMKFSNGSDSFIRYADWEYAPLGQVLYEPISGSRSNIVDGYFVGFTTAITGYVTYHHIGSGWYSTNAAAVPPTGSSANGSTLAIRLYFGSSYVTLRESTNRSTFDEPGFSGEFVYAGAKLTVNVRSTSGSSSMVDQRAYVYTFVNIFGEEGPPSPAAEIAVPEGRSVDLTMAGYLGSGYAPITKIRLYRTATGSNATDYLFVAEFDVASSVLYTDKLLSASLGESLSTLNFLPPEDGLTCLRSLPNGILVAIKGNEIHFSEPYLPYAWNPENVITTQDSCVGICVADGGFYVTTRSNPYFISGITPDAMSQIKITAIQAGVSKGSACNIGSAVVYASNDGIVTARGIDASLDLSFKFFTRKDWRKRYGDKLDKIRINAHDGHLVVWFEDGTPGFLIRYDEVEPSLTKLSRGFYAAAVHPKDDALYVSIDGSSLVAFKGDLDRVRSYQWHSKDFIVPSPTNFGACQVVGSGDVRVQVFADGALVKDKTVTAQPDGKTIFRLPAGFRKRRWSVALSGTGEVQEFNLAVSPSEFANV